MKKIKYRTTMNNLPSCAVNAHLHQFDKISDSHIHKLRIRRRRRKNEKDKILQKDSKKRW